MRSLVGFSSWGNHCSKAALTAVFAAFVAFAPRAAAVSGDAPVEPPPQGVEVPRSARTMLAEPISPLTTQRFPHLQRFQGHVLLAGPVLQAVLAGVPAVRPTTDWQQALLAIFELHGDEWVMKRTDGAFDLRNAAIPGLQAAVVDVGRDAEADAVYATFVYMAASKPRQLVTYRLDAEPGRLVVVFDDITVVDGDVVGAVKAASQWRLRLRGGGTHVDVGSDEATRPRGHAYSVSANGADVAALIGYRPFTIDVTPAGREIAAVPDPQNRQAAHGYELWLTRRGAARVVRRAYDVRECLFGAFRPKTLPKPEARLAWVVGCETDAPRTALTLTLADGEPGGERVPQSVFVFGPGGVPLVQAALLAGDSTTVDVPQGEELTLADTAAGRLVEGVEPLTLARGETRVMALPPREKAVVRVDVGVSRSPALLSVRRLDAAGQEAGVLALDAAGPRAEPVGPTTWLVRSWPVLLDVMPGGYEVTLARGGVGSFCRARLKAKTGDPVTVPCTPPVEPARERLFADLGFALGGASDVALGDDARTYGVALGVDLLTRPASTRGAPRRKGRDATVLPTLSAVDEASGITLTLIPAGASLADRWQKIKPARAQDVAAAFARFAREEGGLGLLELGCPGPGVSAVEYEMLAARVDPDAVRLFGCHGDEAQRAWLDLWTRLSAARAQPLVLTSVSRLTEPDAETFPRLAFPPVRGRDPQAVLLAAARSGILTATAGTRVEIVSLTPIGGTVDQPGKKPKQGDLVLAVAPAGGVVAGTVAVYSERGLLKSEALPTAGGASEVRMQLPWPDGQRLIRAEVIAPDGRITSTTALRSILDLARAATPAVEGAP